MSEFVVIPDWYTFEDVVEVPMVERYAPGIFNVSTCLYVGVRPEDWGGTPHPNSFEQALLRIAARGFVDGVELWRKYIERIRAKPPRWLRRLHEMDITMYPLSWEDSYDLVVWYHGPEHARSPEKGKQGILNCFQLGKRVLVGTPWGESDNTTWGGFDEDPHNPHESHGWEVKPEELVELGLTVYGLNCRTPDEPNQDEPCGHILAWSD